MTSSQHGSYVWGFTHATMGETEGRDTARWSQSQKYAPSSDCSLQLDCMKAESLVNAGQLYCAGDTAAERIFANGDTEKVTITIKAG